MSLRWRLAAILAGLVAVAIGTATLLSYVGIRNELLSQVDTFLERRAEEVVSGRRGWPDSFEGFEQPATTATTQPGTLPGNAVLDPEGTEAAPFRPPQGPGGGQGQGDGSGNRQDGDGRGNGNGSATPLLPTIEADAVIQVLDDTGALWYSSTGASYLPVDDVDRTLATEGGEPVMRDVDVDGMPVRVIAAPLDDGGVVQVGRDLVEQEDALSTLATGLVGLTVLGTLVAGILGFLVARRLTRPLRSLANAAEEVADTQVLTTPIEVDRTDEVGRVATSFNTMLAALETSRLQQHQLVQDASHELRTPLTSLRTSIEVLARATDLDTPEARRLLDRATFELAELSELVTELVELATDTAEDEPEEEVELDRLVEDVVAQFRRRTTRTIELDAAPTVVSGRPTALTRAVRNLVGNATKFSPADEPILVRVGEGGVEVLDRGPGIPPEDRERIFDRFYRSTATRTMPGSGLGLAIVAQVVDAHDGTVWAGEHDGGGAAVGFRLPELDRTGTGAARPEAGTGDAEGAGGASA